MKKVIDQKPEYLLSIVATLSSKTLTRIRKYMTEVNQILWSKLPKRDVKCKPYQKRVLEFDPTNIPNVYPFKPHQRHHSISIANIFPIRYDVRCACGCGAVLPGRRSRWATEECQKYAVAVRFILAGSSSVISTYLKLYYGWKCFVCECDDKGHDMGANGVVAWIKVDHIIPVKNGGGACWLSNYQLLCHDCHVPKTNKDFNWKSAKLNCSTELPFVETSVASEAK